MGEIVTSQWPQDGKGSAMAEIVKVTKISPNIKSIRVNVSYVKPCVTLDEKMAYLRRVESMTTKTAKK